MIAVFMGTIRSDLRASTGRGTDDGFVCFIWVPTCSFGIVAGCSPALFAVLGTTRCERGMQSSRVAEQVLVGVADSCS